MMNIKRIISMSVSMVLVFSSSVNAAKSISDLKKDMQQRSSVISEKKAQISKKESERDAQIAKRMQLDVQISGIEQDIDDVKSLILEKDVEIDEKNERIDKLEKEISETKGTLEERVRIMYEYGNATYIEIIMDSKGFGDFLTRVSLVKDIVTHDKTIINEYIAAQKEMEEAKKVIEKEKKEQEQAKSILEDKKSGLVKLQSEKQEIIDDINSDIKKLESQERAAEEDYKSIQAEIKRAQAEAAKKEKEEKAAKEKKASNSNSAKNEEKKSSDGGSSSSKSSQEAKKGSGNFVWPSESSHRITSSFGSREKPNAAATSNHRGIDIGASSGTNVLAADSGRVIVAGSNRSYGNYVVIDHGNGYTTLYAHNSRLCVDVNDTVSAGDVIAKVGSTGNSTGPHIHFEVSKNGSVVDPMNFF